MVGTNAATIVLPQLARMLADIRESRDTVFTQVEALLEAHPTLLRTGSLEDAATAKEELEILVKAAARTETNRLHRTVCRWWTKIEVLIIAGVTTGKVEANNTGIKHIRSATQLQQVSGSRVVELSY